MIDPHFVFLGALLSVVGSARYAYQTVRGQTMPNRVTWILWATAPIIGFAAQLDEGVGLPSVLTLAIGVGPAMIVVASFVNPASYWRVSRFDLVCGSVSVVALVVWLGLDDAVLAVLVSVLADLLAGVPTIVKAWRHPETETPLVFALAGCNGVITLFTIDTWTPATYAFPLYIALLGIGMFLVVVLRARAAPPSTGDLPTG